MDKKTLQQHLKLLEADRQGREDTLKDTSRKPNDLLTQQALYGLPRINEKIEEIKNKLL